MTAGMTILFTPPDDEGTIIASVPDFPGVLGQGSTVGEAAADINRAFSSLVDAAASVGIKHGMTTQQVLNAWRDRREV